MNDNDCGSAVTAGRSVCVSTVSAIVFRLAFACVRFAVERSFCSGTWEGRMPVVFSGARYVSPALCCALFGVRGSSGVNSGALCSTIACRCSVSAFAFAGAR